MVPTLKHAETLAMDRSHRNLRTYCTCPERPRLYVRRVQDCLLFPTPSFRGILAVRVPGQAREFYEASLAALTHKDTSDGGSRTYANVVGTDGDAVLSSMFLIATAVVPTIYNSNHHIDQASGVDPKPSQPKPVCPSRSWCTRNNVEGPQVLKSAP